MLVSSQIFSTTNLLLKQTMEQLVNARFIELETITCSSAKRISNHSNTKVHKKSRVLLIIIGLKISDHKLPRRNMPQGWKMTATFLRLKVQEMPLRMLVYTVEVGKLPRASFSPTRYSIQLNKDSLMSRYHPIIGCAKTCWLAVRSSKAWTSLLSHLRTAKTQPSRQILIDSNKTNRFGNHKTLNNWWTIK